MFILWSSPPTQILPSDIYSSLNFSTRVQEETSWYWLCAVSFVKDSTGFTLTDSNANGIKRENSESSWGVSDSTGAGKCEDDHVLNFFWCDVFCLCPVFFLICWSIWVHFSSTILQSPWLDWEVNQEGGVLTCMGLRGCWRGGRGSSSPGEPPAHSGRPQSDTDGWWLLCLLRKSGLDPDSKLFKCWILLNKMTNLLIVRKKINS